MTKLTLSTWLILLGDVVTLALFVYLGQRDHATLDDGAPWRSVLTTTSYFALPWLFVAAWQGAFAPPQTLGLWAWLKRALTAWLIAAPLGILLRASVLAGFELRVATINASFFLVTLGLCGAFVLAWRALAWWLARRFAQPGAVGVARAAGAEKREPAG